MSERNKNFYSLEELKRAKDCYKGYQDGEEVYYFVGTLRYACDEIERLNNIIKHTDSWIDRTIEIIKQQPSEDDTWILERLNGIKQCLQGSDKE